MVARRSTVTPIGTIPTPDFLRVIQYVPGRHINKAAVMQPEASIKANLMNRQVCDRCHHFHRRAIYDRCLCCKNDGEVNDE